MLANPPQEGSVKLSSHMQPSPFLLKLGRQPCENHVCKPLLVEQSSGFQSIPPPYPNQINPTLGSLSEHASLTSHSGNLVQPRHPPGLRAARVSGAHPRLVLGDGEEAAVEAICH